MAKFASVESLHLCWANEKDIISRVDAGGRLVVASDSSPITASELHCVDNAGLLGAYMVRQRGARCLDIPDVESLKGEILALHVTRVLDKQRQKSKPKALMEATVQLVEGNSHLDAKSIKRLLSYARYRFLKRQSPRDPLMHVSFVHKCPNPRFM